MSCCGEARDNNAPANNAGPPKPTQAVNQQPAATPAINWQQQRDFSPSGNGYVSPPPTAMSPVAFSQAYPTTPMTQSPNPTSMDGRASPWMQTGNGTVTSNGYPTPPQTGSPPPVSPPPGAYMGGSGPFNSMGVHRPTPIHAVGASSYSQTSNDMQMGGEPDDGKLVVSVDFGTTMSGVAYGSSRLAGGKVQQILNWPGTQETYRKIPTCLLYDHNGRVLAWGMEAKNAGAMEGTYRCEWFKLYLEPNMLRNSNLIDPRLPPLPPGKQAIDLIIDFLSCMWEYAKEQITRNIGAVADLDAADVWLTVPAAWDAAGCGHMRNAAIAAGLVQSARAGDMDWRERLRIITEPEAAAVHCVSLTDLHRLRNSQTFMICDAGGGTVDLAIYKVIGKLEHLEIAEVCARSGASCGSIFLDLRFKDLVKTLLAEHPQHLDPPSLANFMHTFSEGDKIEYAGESDDNQKFTFTCFNPEDPTDPSVGLINGELVVPGILLRREVFDPVVSQVLNLIEMQAAKVMQPIDALLLVGGFSQSQYLFKKIDEQFGSRIKVIARPDDADTATLRGAAQYGLARRPLVSSVIAPRSYIMKVKLPAEELDLQRRPAYIRDNDAGVQICENRLQYLVTKGAILRKGQRLKTKFCKFSVNATDRTFVADLYISDADNVMRYTDEGDLQELCKWTVDLGTLPTFQQYSNMPHPNGFYTDFELGLELDSAEVRGVLLHQGQEWGRVVFDFLN